MSAKKEYVQLDILDGENALAMLGQLIDLARGHPGPHFKIKVVDAGFIFLHGPVHEIGVNITGLKAISGDEWELEGNLDENLLEESENEWLRSLLEDGGLSPMFGGVYYTNKRNGYICFSL